LLGLRTITEFKSTEDDEKFGTGFGGVMGSLKIKAVLRLSLLARAVFGFL
jgi:hypothetical protein